jgi:hypothetical protein
MTERTRDLVRGKKLRWTFADGPAKGSSFEHEFRGDGTVAYRSVDESSSGNADKKAKSEVADYGSALVADDVQAVSYRSENGYTLTVVLNFADKRMVGFASNSEEWFEQSGTFEVLD